MFCEVLFGVDQGQRVQAMVVESTGRPCPCKRGEVCPLIKPPSGEQAHRVAREIGDALTLRR